MTRHEDQPEDSQTKAEAGCGSEESLNETLEFHNAPSIGSRCYRLMTLELFYRTGFFFPKH